MNLNVSLKDELICCTDQPLSTFTQKFFTKFYQPLLTLGAANLYLYFHSLINYGDLESKKITHNTLFKALNNLNITDFLSFRYELEALGLIETYVLEQTEDVNQYMIILKRLPLAFEFFNNEVLSTMLKNKIGSEAYNELISSFLIHSRDISNFKNITKSIDEVYYVGDVNCTDVSNFWINTDYSSVEFKNTHFDYEYFIILASARNLLSPTELKSVTLYENINRLSWMFSLDTEKMVKALQLSIKDGVIDYESLRLNCKNLADSKKIELKKVMVKEESNSKLVNTLNSISPSVLVQNKYNTTLTSAEIAMFDKLLVSTGIGAGVLNALIIYVLESKNGEIPSYNYFLKIINTWIRKGVKTTNDALVLISNSNDKVKKKPTTSWYQEYVEELDNKKKESIEEKKEKTESLSDLEEFFNSK